MKTWGDYSVGQHILFAPTLPVPDGQPWMECELMKIAIDSINVVGVCRVLRARNVDRLDGPLQRLDRDRVVFEIGSLCRYPQTDDDCGAKHPDEPAARCVRCLRFPGAIDANPHGGPHYHPAVGEWSE